MRVLKGSILSHDGVEYHRLGACDAPSSCYKLHIHTSSHFNREHFACGPHVADEEMEAQRDEASERQS